MYIAAFISRVAPFIQEAFMDCLLDAKDWKGLNAQHGTVHSLSLGILLAVAIIPWNLKVLVSRSITSETPWYHRDISSLPFYSDVPRLIVLMAIISLLLLQTSHWIAACSGLKFSPESPVLASFISSKQWRMTQEVILSEWPLKLGWPVDTAVHSPDYMTWYRKTQSKSGGTRSLGFRSWVV